MISVELMDPFLMQSVTIPFITIGYGVLASVFSKKILVSPIVTLIINALYEIYYFKEYYSEISFTSCNIIFPIVSLVISLIIVPAIKTKEKPSIT